MNSRHGPLLGALLLAACQPAGATPSYARHHGTTAYEDFEDAVVTPGEGAVVVGSARESSGADDDGWIVELDVEARILWQLRIGGDLADEYRNVSRATNGDLVVAGHARSFTGDGLRHSWLTRFDPTGAIRWELVHDSFDWDRVWDLEATSDDGAIAVGEAHDGVPEVDFSWVMKLDANGGAEWLRTIPLDLARAVTQVTDGGFVVAGYAGDPWVFKFDPAGDVSWGRQVFFGEAAKLEHVTARADGGVDLVGTAGTILTGWDPTDLFVLTLDAAGNLSGQAEYALPGVRLEAFDCERMADGGLAVVGHTRRETPLLSGAWWAQVLPDGSLGWNGRYENISASDTASVVPLPNGDVILVGNSGLPAVGGNDGHAIRLRAGGQADPPCPMIVYGGFVAGTKRATVAPYAEPIGTATPILLPATSTVTVTDAVTEEICCPYPDLPQEVSGPGAAVPLTFRDHYRFGWEEAAESGSCWFNVYRGRIPDLRAGARGACFNGFPLVQPLAADGADIGAGWFYLVTGINELGEGPLGADSFGTPRTNATPCP